MRLSGAVVLVLISAACHGYEAHVLVEGVPLELWGLEEGAEPWDALRELGAEMHRAFKHAVGGEVSNEISEGVDMAVRLGLSLVSEVRDSSEGVWEQISEEAERLASQLEEETRRRVVAIESHAEAYASEVRRKIDQNLLEIQRNTVPVVHTFRGQLEQTALNIRKSAQSLLGGFATLWESE
ncbi:apolipoprotein A-IV-like [Engraulis encrasicolus]|uniref:apolipoprotein A-IV-like n=1 Tax=Engraulis encrasicolus TaxID=184585 RepID=UPI002FD55EFD